MIRLLVAGLTALALSADASPSAAPPPSNAETGATAVLVRISGPGIAPVSLGELEWPTSTVADVQSFRYPDSGSIVSIGRSDASVFAAPGSAATTQARANVIVLSLFEGEVVAAQVTASVSAGASARSAKADVSASTVQGLRVMGQDVSTNPGAIAALGDWGTVTVLSPDQRRSQDRTTGSAGDRPPGSGYGSPRTTAVCRPGARSSSAASRRPRWRT